MAALVCEQIMRVLCNNHGCMEFRQLDVKLRQGFTVDQRLLEKVLLDNTNFKIVDDKQRDSDPRILRPEAFIVARTDLRVCTSPGKCAQCQQLHICRYLVSGSCRFGTKCENSHDLNSPHNSALLTKYRLQYLTGTQLFQLLLQNDPTLVPEICPHYNKGEGDHGSCKFNTSCKSLHVCKYFFQEDCSFGTKCKRAHKFDDVALKNFEKRGLSSENVQNLPKIYKNKLHLTRLHDQAREQKPRAEKVRQPSSSSVSEADRNEICLFFVRNGCSFKEKCVRVHHELPYKWEILDKDGVTWKHLPNEEEIEKAYCNPANDKSLGPLLVDFTSMTCDRKPVRRLSTVSSVTKPPHFILTTEWLWYWKNDQGEWTEYVQRADAKRLSSVTSKTLENIFMAEVDNEVHFSVGAQKYELNIRDMYQKNMVHKTERKVRRRPRFVSAREVKGKSKSDDPESSGISAVIPAHWDKGTLPSFSYKFVPLLSSASDYERVATLFKRTMHSSTIHSIKRVQNPSLWKVFQWQKEQMKERNGGKDVEERYLFHGTDQSLIDAICDQNFDWRVSGIHGSSYGKGSYFARDAIYSNKYAKSKGTTKIMFVALVLVGEFTKGSSSFLRPPQNSCKTGFYDSCVDNVANPSIFVIFEKYQIYPEYLVEYS